MDKTLAALYAVSVIGKSQDYRSNTHKPQVAPAKEEADITKSYFTKIKNLVDRLRR